MSVLRPVVIAANWKMNGSPVEAGALAAAIARSAEAPHVERVICPPYVALAAVRDALAGTGVATGAQNVHAETAGAYTGEISASMLEGLATWCIVGHSERRRDQAETDDEIGRKLVRCVGAGIRPILCVGERLEDREAGTAEATVRAQLERAIESLLATGATGATGAGDRDQSGLVVAYEPVWAIGTGRTASGADAAAMADLIRNVLAHGSWPRDPARVPVLYGGSVTSASIGEFLAEPAIDGALVGGASLKVDEMAGILARAELTAVARAGTRAGS